MTIKLPQLNEDVLDFDSYQSEVLERHRLKIVNLEAHIDNLNSKIDLIITNTLGTSGVTKEIPLPTGYVNPIIIGIQYQNANNAWLNIVGEKSNTAELEVRSFGGILRITHNLSALNGKGIRVALVK